MPCDKKCSFGRQTGFIFIQAATFTFEGEVDMHVVPFHTIEYSTLKNVLWLVKIVTWLATSNHNALFQSNNSVQNFYEIGSWVWWLREETHNWVFMSLNPNTIYWMAIFILICCQNCIVCLKILKRGRVGPNLKTGIVR